MKTITINTERELKKFVAENRSKITAINGVNFRPMYPILEVTNRSASYYDVESQGNRYLTAPFILSVSQSS